MEQKKSSKRASKNTGVKVLIATASVAATLVGWALLPANDPQATAATGSDQTGQQQAPAFVAPSSTDNGSGSTNTLPQMPGIQQPVSPPSDNQLPQIQAPQGFSNSPMPFTRSHSSR